ncbi:pilus assembly protein [Rhodoferax sp.]|uniref:pilus assembly protein n=1 Tax=Rhodoferax sp. TaxID=50421 RepID=UPI002777651F|nr:PilC/PilY family type IV pilus protein [Rhodoferax sp.]
MSNQISTNTVTPRVTHPRSALWTAFWVAGLTATSVTAHAVGLTLATAPPGSGGREPAPNVIVSVDDSGSMGWDVNGCATTDWNLAIYGSYFNEAGATGCPTPASNPNPSRIASLKAALNAQFGSATKIPDNRIRLAWQAMWNNGGASGAASLTTGATNSMKPLTGAHRTNFITFANSLKAGYGTPSHKMMQQAYDYMRSAAGTNSPWADNPGTAQATPYLACRRSYHVFMTDGAWNSEGSPTTGNRDGTAVTLPDGTPYAPATSNQVRAYKDAHGGTKGTLADHAFRNWATDLQDGTGGTQAMANSITGLMRVKTDEPVGATTLTPYWNPKNDPATWQHLVQHTIGFGKSASTWTGNPTWDNLTDNNYGGGYSALVNGTVGWQDPMPSAGEITIRPSELWHSALNGRGKFYPARNPAALEAAFGEILDNILADTGPTTVSIGANSTTTRTVSNAFVASYDASLGWAGNLVSYALSSSGDMSATPVWWAAGKDASGTPRGLDKELPVPFDTGTRLVLSHNGTAGISWKWANLSVGQKTAMKTGGDTDVIGENRLNYVRGDKTKEVSAAPPGSFRSRTTRLGDIVNSNVWYVGKPSGGYAASGYAGFASANYTRAPMVYVGANDGMLHGFLASDGEEKLAYVPKGVLGKFINFSSPSYVHEYFVDAQPFSGDADFGGWKTVLVGGLGGGGKGYYILDITNPANFMEANASTLVVADTTDSVDADLGYIYSPPVIDDGRPDKSQQIVKMNNGKWAVVLGNGYNSSLERPVLIVHFLDGTAPVKITPTCATSCPSFIGDGNGLSTPRLIDLNIDGTVDVAYAGDLKGNLWKFDLSATTSTGWVVAFSNAPYFVAKSPSNVRQPIMTAPYTIVHPKGGIMVAFGTGRNVTSTDPGTLDTDTLWAVWDNSALSQSGGVVTMTAPTLGVVNTGAEASRPASLVQQFHSTVILDGTKKLYNVTRNAVVYTFDASTKRGWYIDWPNGGQRVLHNPTLYNGERILVQSTIPQSGSGTAGETCTPLTSPGSTFISVFSLFTGNPSKNQVFIPVDGSIVPANLGTTQVDPNDYTRINKDGSVIMVGADRKKSKTLTGQELGIRSNWREYQ